MITILNGIRPNMVTYPLYEYRQLEFGFQVSDYRCNRLNVYINQLN